VAMKNFVEINITERTDRQTVDKVEKFLKSTGKYSLVLKGKNHFIINRMFLKMQAGCCGLVERGEMDVSEIDMLIKKYLFPTGVFEFLDYVGNDVMLQSVKNYLVYERDADFYLPMKNVLARKVAAGRLGKKIKAGFYDYPLKNAVTDTEITRKKEEILHRITHWYLDGVFDVLNRNLCSREELERIVKEYMMTDKSPFDLAVETGFK
jgi:3-hydroxyacyl-CoA dehydrogenase